MESYVVYTIVLGLGHLIIEKSFPVAYEAVL